LKTITTTKNFWDAFFLKISHRRNTIVFRNGIKAEANWTEFCALRDGFDDLRNASLVIKKAEEGYHVQKAHPQLIHTAASLKDVQNFSKFILSIFSHGWNVEQVNDKSFTAKKENVSYDIHKLEDGLLEITSDKFKMIGPPDAAGVIFSECDLYKCDYANKVVLDVGSFSTSQIHKKEYRTK
jgi:hypothetical protein